MGLMGTCSTWHVSITAADDADGADANAAFRGSPPIAVPIYLERSPAAMAVTNTRSVRLGRLRNRSDRLALVLGRKPSPSGRTRSGRAATAFDNACCCAPPAT
jgi:hypothetical protein